LSWALSVTTCACRSEVGTFVPNNEAEEKENFERVRSVREASTGASARRRRLSPVWRRLLLLLLPALVGRFDRCRSSHANMEIANERFGRWMVLGSSHLVNSSDLGLGMRQCRGIGHHCRAVFLTSGTIGCFACDIYLGASSSCGFCR